MVPFVVAAVTGRDDADNFCWHLCAIAALRYVNAQVWISLSRVHALTRGTRIQAKGIDFKQVDREDHWDDYILLQTLVMAAVHWMPKLGFSGFPAYSGVGVAQLALLHAGPTEFIYYWLHRALHHHKLYNAYHSHHHASFVTEPITGSVHPFMEHLMYTANFAIPLLGTWALGGASIAMFYIYLLGFDVLNAIGHCNFEFIPRWFMRIPGMKYLIYTPSYHSLHHSRVHTNFCLFMPLYDYVYGTADVTSDELYEKAITGKAVPVTAPDVVFMAHGTELLSVFHLPFMLRSFSSRPFVSSWWLKPFWPLCVPFVLLLRVFGKSFVADRHRLRKLACETWVTPAWGFQFFIKSEFNHINRKIEEAILQADKSGVKVVGLGALNKNEALNGGGALFVKKHGKNLKTRVVHGNTLTAAAILQKLPG
jgi:sterol desaturase/sphingolipid hydroxylase (fatty acid hydroxylase superfamily)